jgi:uncharacterized protein YecT (DUF1311 family)
MKKLLFALLLPLTALADYSGPAVETCRAHAQAEAKHPVRIDNDRHLHIERYTRKVGSQFVASVLYGNGAVLFPNAPVEMSFTCLLVSDKQAVMFYWLPHFLAPVLRQCTRDPARKPAECVEPLLTAAEIELLQVNARLFQQAHDADTKAGGTARVDALRRSGNAFNAYRDAECARRGPAASDAYKACVVDLTRRRARDLE